MNETPTIEQTPAEASNGFVNPWEGQERRDRPSAVRLNAIVPIEAFNRVKQCRLGNGTIQTTINLLWQKLIHELDKRNITDVADEQSFEFFVANCQLCLPGETARQPAGPTVLGSSTVESHAQPHGDDVGGGVAPLRGTPPGATLDDTNPQGVAKSPGRDRSRKPAKGVKKP